MSPADLHQHEEAIAAAMDTDLSLAERRAREYLAATPPGLARGDRSPRFRATSALAHIVLRAGRLSETVELLTPLLPFTGPAHTELGAEVRLLLAEAHARAGRPQAARPLLDEVPPSRLAADTDQRLRALRVRLRLGDRVSADEIAGCAADLASRGDRHNEALLWCDAGRAAYTAGALADADRYFRRAEQRGSGEVLADALMQRGRVEHLRGLAAVAADLYEQARRHGLPGQKMEARLRLALALAELGRPDVARAEVAALTGQEVPEEVCALDHFTRSVLAGESGGLPDDARTHYLDALAAAAGPAREARIHLALGLLGDGPDGGEARLRRAEELARRHGLDGILCRVLLALGERAAAVADGEAKARPLFEEASSLAEGEAAQVDGIIGSLARRRGALRHLLVAACRQGDPAAALDYQERERGRLLLEWMTAAGAAKEPALCDRPDWRALADELAQCERALCASASEERAALGRRLGELLARRDHLLERHLLESDRPAALLPAPPCVAGVSASLPPGTLYAAPVLGADRFYLLGVHRGGAEVIGGGPAERVRSAAAAFLAEVEAQTKHYEQGYALGPADRQRLDGLLEDLGRGPLGEALEELLQRYGPTRVMWAADEGLHGLPVHAVRRGGRYLIERAEVCHTPGASLMVEHRRGRQRGSWRAAVAFAEAPAVLPAASREAEGVAAVFLRGRCVMGAAADRRQLRQWLRRARIVHLACHAEFEPHRPLAARLRLPSGDYLHALEWLDEPVAGLALVTLSACRAGAAAPLAGGEAFGLATGLLAGRVRAVVAGLWKVADAEAPPLMWSFYRHLIRHPVATALALAQREGLSSATSSPLFWAAFALFGDPRAVPAPPLPWRWLAGWRQRRHRRRYQR